jgi:hypothetical protein
MSSGAAAYSKRCAQLQRSSKRQHESNYIEDEKQNHRPVRSARVDNGGNDNRVSIIESSNDYMDIVDDFPGASENREKYDIQQNNSVISTFNVDEFSWAKYNTYSLKVDLEAAVHKIESNWRAQICENNEPLNTNPLFPNCPLSRTTAISKLRSVIYTLGLNNKDCKVLVTFVNSILPTDTQPLSEDTICRKSSTCSDSFKGTMSSGIFEYDCCRCGGVVYAGSQNKELVECTQCEGRRKTNDLQNRYSSAKLFYRPISLIIMELLKTKGFISALNYKFLDQNLEKDGLIADVYNGITAKQSLLAMQTNFNNFVNRNGNQTLKPLVPISLLLAFYYDGVQIFRRKVQDFFPMVFSILNLPPSMRSTTGMGLFTLSLIDYKTNSNCTTFMLELFAQELQYLEKGFVVNINDVNYYIQCRLILQCYDSKGLESVLNVEGANSYIGCGLCRQAEG